MILCNKSPLGINILVGEDACLFSIKYDGNDDKFSKPIRLVGNVLVFCVQAQFLKSDCILQVFQSPFGHDAYRVQGFIIISYHAASDIE